VDVVLGGADVIRPFPETYYGAHEFADCDLEGKLWSFGDYRGEPLPS
jgi:uncharacterized glyoxalase superfamily protein PhnB